MRKIFEDIEMPAAFNEELEAQIKRLKETRVKFREDIISPFEFLDVDNHKQVRGILPFGLIK